MSSQLTIEPITRNKTNLSLDLKFILRKRNGDKTVSGMLVQRSDLPYFMGLNDAGIEGAQTVIDFLQEYDECIINEDF